MMAQRTMPVTAAMLDAYLRSKGSPLAGHGQELVQAGQQYGVDPRLLVAISGGETGFGTTGNATGLHNAWGMGPGRSYPTWTAGIDATAQNLGQNYIGQGLKTIPAIAAKWAPIGAGNDPTNLNSNWVRTNSQFYRELGGSSPAIGGTPTSAPQQASGWTGVIGVPDKIIGTPYSGTHTLGNWESDNAVDLAAPVGTPIYAFQSGVIGPQFGSLGSSSSRFAGLRLHVRSKGNEAYYAHLSKFAPGIQPGAQVTRGQLLGYSGEANGVGHLHFGVESGDPRNFIGPGGAAAAPTADAASRQTLSARAPAAAPTPTAPRALPAAVKQALAILRS